jgi:hypothetical protein
VLGSSLGDMETLVNEVLGMSLGRRLGRSLGDMIGNEVPSFSLGDIEILGYALGSGDGIWLGCLLAGWFWDTLGRSFDGKVLGISLFRRLVSSLGDTVTLENDVRGISLGKIETLGYVLGSDDGI